MAKTLILASGSETRADLLRRAGVLFETEKPRLDEDAMKQAFLSDGLKPRDIADGLAESKARKIAGKYSEAMVLGCDQVLDFNGELLSKPKSKEEAISQLKAMTGRKHKLFSAAVIYEGSQPVWRSIGEVRLYMRDATSHWLGEYVDRNWDSIRHSVGGYCLEGEGVRLFERVEGDYFNVLGMPLLEVLSYLTLRGTLPS